METKCQNQSGVCETGASTCATTQSQECCPIETATGMWSQAFCDAMHETQVDILKTKIQKAWGGQMEKVADAVLESMEVQWQSMLAQGKAKVELKEKLKKIFTEGKR